MKIVVLDGYAVNREDADWKPVESVVSEITIYDRTPPEEVINRIGDADGILICKVKINTDIMRACPNLKFVGVTATGYDNVDINAAKENGVAVFNVPAYSTESVAQHTFALILAIANNVSAFDKDVKDGKWYESKDFAMVNHDIMLLHGKSLGIIGYGSIGKLVANIATALGMKVNIYSQDKTETLKSDIISLHCPATPENIGFVNKEFIAKLNDGVIIINTARGALLNENDVREALISGKIKALGVDVLAKEPPVVNHPFIELPNCFATSHVAWAPLEMRKKVIEVCRENIETFKQGGDKNRIV